MAATTENEVRDTVTRIKICGITNLEDALVALDCGADMLGVIRVLESPRCVPGNDLLLHLNSRNRLSNARLVGVYRDRKDAEEDRDAGLFSLIQAYSDTLPYGQCMGFPRYIDAYAVRDAGVFAAIEADIARKRIGSAVTSALLLDTYHKDKLGGSGETFNWELAIEAKQRFGLPLMLAGGLTPENVGEAVRTVRPYSVDVSSGVEAEPGRKDHAKVKAFIQAVREADRQLSER